jgi:hypothetical protein
MPYVIVPDQPREDAPPGHEYDHLVTSEHVLFDSAEDAYAHPVTPGGDVIVLRCEPPAVTERSAWERIQVVWTLPDNRTVLEVGQDGKNIVGKISSVILTALRAESDSWLIEEVHLSGHYIVSNGEVSGMAVYRDYGDEHRCYKLRDLPVWISDLVKAELDGRSAR